MSILDDTVSEYNRSKLAVWDYPVSDRYTKVFGLFKVLWSKKRQVHMFKVHSEIISFFKLMNQLANRVYLERYTPREKAFKIYFNLNLI